MPDPDLVALIYEAAFIPELWPKVLDKIASQLHAAGGLLFTVSPQIRWTASQGAFEITKAFVEEGWSAHNPRPARAAALDHEGFVSDLDIFEEHELETYPYYRDFLWKRGFGWCAGTVIQPPGGDLLTFSWERRRDVGPFTRRELASADGLRPHLARAGALANRLCLEQAVTMTSTLQRLGLPACVLSKRYSALSCNAAFEALMPSLFQDTPSRLRATNSSSDRQLGNILHELSLSGAVVSKSMPVRGREENAPAVIHFLPLPGRASDIFTSALCLLVVTPMSLGGGNSKQILKGLFDLTPAESKLTEALISGGNLAGYAASMNISYHTARTHLRSILQKTESHSQSDLIRLFLGHSSWTIPDK